MNECKAYACAKRGCGHTIHLHHDLEERLRRTGERFYCPAGHSQFFPTKKDDRDQRIARLEHQVANWRERLQEVYEEREEWKLRAKACPFACGFRSRRRIAESIEADLILHICEEHGARMPEQVAEVVSA